VVEALLSLSTEGEPPSNKPRTEEVSEEVSPPPSKKLRKEALEEEGEMFDMRPHYWDIFNESKENNVMYDTKEDEYAHRQQFGEYLGEEEKKEKEGSGKSDGKKSKRKSSKNKIKRSKRRRSSKNAFLLKKNIL
jgi:hypothetical protein